MALPQLSWILLLLLAGHTPRTLSCPIGCRCYSQTVECGSIGLREIPPGVPPLIQTFFLQDNSIGQIRLQDLSRLGQLHYLYLQNNSISALEPGAFRSQAQLLELALNGNRIHLLSAQIFQGLEHLRILYLSGNQITRLQDHTFRCLQRLQELHLQQNSVEVLGEEALAGLSSLALLDLSRNNLRTLQQGSLRPLVSLQVLRLTDNPWRCDCALHWLRGWINGGGQRLLSSSERRLLCAEPPRLSQRSLVEVPGNSLVCIPPVVQLEPRRLSVRLGENLRVSCQASGYPQPQVTWRKLSRGRTPPGLSPKGLVQEAGPGPGAGPEAGPELGGGVTARPGGGANGGGAGEGAERFDRDTGSGMLFLSNVTVAHAGRYECEAWNPGGVARVTFHLSVNVSSSASSADAAAAASRPSGSAPSSGAGLRPRGAGVSQEPLYVPESMDFRELSAATQTAIGAAISLLALTALLLLAMIYGRHRRRRRLKQGPADEAGVLYVNDYSDGPTTFAQLEEYRDERGHEMYVLNRSKPVLAPPLPPPPAPPTPRGPTPSPSQDLGGGVGGGGGGGAGGVGLRRPAEGGEGVAVDPEALFLSQGLLFDTQMAYEIHC
ncbi:leucine-rich repeat-containing protein 24 [Anguilla anguilla]|uniref:leucine-rich repeat-containing protein 24 n=1 Tax=Anguilla anguilla TaxID=7936 RepID=UPI0015AEF884|nr:leucine-rich repeat-containing protein 24 [Anguilla anguilla]XP_035286052.1 leucine-rich repeat-containing protein 24 [Anguilla anguilla]